MTHLGNGLCEAKHYEDAVTVDEAKVSMLKRLGTPEERMLIAQSNLAATYRMLGRREEALRLWQDNYTRRSKLSGDEHKETIREAICYALGLIDASRFKDAKALMCKTLPVARRVISESHDLTLRIRKVYARALFMDASTTLNDLREAVTTLEETERIARRVLGGAHPIAAEIEDDLQDAREVLELRSKID